MWICNDISINESFLRGCDVCNTGKRYRTKHEACQHLRSTHFAPETTRHALSRWLSEEEEANPNFGLKPGKKPPKTKSASKRQKTDETTLKIAPLKSAPQGNVLLPPMRVDFQGSGANDIELERLEPDQDRRSNELNRSLSNLSSLPSGVDTSDFMLGVENSATDVLGSDQPKASKSATYGPVGPSLVSSTSDTAPDLVCTESKVDNKSHSDLVLPDVSFDNLIGIRGLISSYHDSNGPPHRSKQALIKPDQVSRLPHLDQTRKDVCSDQVVALYYHLDQENPETKKYKDQLGKLEQLSRILMRNLKDWQRERSRAPIIPFSLN